MSDATTATGETMRAFQVTNWGSHGTYTTVPKPSPGPGQILIRMRAAGLCRSDLDMFEGSPVYRAALTPGFTMGHENAGTVAALGEGVADLRVGDAVVVYEMRKCGSCDFCTDGLENYCERYKSGPIPVTRGVGVDGGLAPFLVVPRAEAVAVGDADPVMLAPLTDAGAVAYHSVLKMLPKLKPGTTAAVIGAGGLGWYGVQLLRALSQAEVFVVDISERRLALVEELGVPRKNLIVSDKKALENLREATNGRGLDAVVDFVGTDETLQLCLDVTRTAGRIVVVGMEGGTAKLGWGAIASGCDIVFSIGSTVQDLKSVCALAAAGKVKTVIEKFTFDQIQEAYDALKAGTLTGRAVIVFD
ncbi:alcohol dehydrogenase GroES domain protein [Neofusicoccum parvum]|uniref:Alcohol dehydrogenase GroES domain protein n=1 Tax=Neofusicoccum parvum TaxID=310453 RepID=A0ACB5RTV3_9PEZI|nr:alcohol dehydrogenase GroES domain protein [Neofusicoccum parvum]